MNTTMQKTGAKDRLVCNDCSILSNNLDSFETQIHGHAKSNMRIQLAHLKQKQAALERELKARDEEIAKVKVQGSEEARRKTREELERAFAVLKHIKKKIGPGFYDAEYHSLVEEVQLI